MKNAVAYMRYKREHLWDFVDFDWKFWNQCVDLIRHYCKTAFNYTMWRIPLLPWDDAPKAKNADQSTFPWWTMYPWSEWVNMKKWDIGITWGTKYWHIFIVDKVENDWYIILEQNGSGKASWKKIPWNEIRLRMCKRWKPPLLRYFRYVENV